MPESGPRLQLIPASAPRPALPHARYFGRYLVLRRIAEGGFGEVYAAADIHTGKQYALKIPLQGDERALEDYWTEVQILRELDHPNVVKLVEAGLISGIPTIVYPLGEGSIADRIDRGMWPSEAIAFSSQLLAGLAHVHERGYLHCDLKPGNLIVFPGDTLAISDFGLARDVLEEGVHTASGTEEYMAPEHREGWVSMHSDVYEAAVVIYEMLTGWLISSPSEASILDELPDSQWARALDPVLRRALDPDPHARFPDGAAFSRAFEAAISKRTVH